MEKCDYSSGLIFESVNLALREFVIQNSVALPKNLAHMIKSEESRKEAHEERRALKVLKNNNAEREGQKLSIYKRGIATVKDVKSFKFILNSQKLAGLESQKYSRATEKIITPSGNMRRDSVSFCGRSNHNNLTSSEGIEDNKSQDKSVSPNRKNFQITSPVFKGNESDVRKYN